MFVIIFVKKTLQFSDTFWVTFYSMSYSFHSLFYFVGSITHTLQDLANVMVDVTVPARERRHAILPDITPMRKSNKPGKAGKGARGGLGEEPINEQDELNELNPQHPLLVVPPPPSSKLNLLNTKIKTIFNKKSDANSTDADPESPVLELNVGGRSRRGAKAGQENDDNVSPFQRRKKPIDVPENPIAKCKARKRIITEQMKPPGHNSFSAMTFLDVKTTAPKPAPPPEPAPPPTKTCNSNNSNTNDDRKHSVTSNNSKHYGNVNSNSFTAIDISPVASPPPPSPAAPPMKRSQRRRAAIFNEQPPTEFEIQENLDDLKNQQQHNFYINNNFNAHARNSYSSDDTSDDESEKSDVELEEDPPPSPPTTSPDFPISNSNNSNRQPRYSSESLGQNSVSSTDDRAIFNPLLMTECL